MLINQVKNPEDAMYFFRNFFKADAKKCFIVAPAKDVENHRFTENGDTLIISDTLIKFFKNDNENDSEIYSYSNLNNLVSDFPNLKAQI